MNVYGLSQFATPVQKMDQTDNQLSELENLHQANIPRNEQMMMGLGLAGSAAVKPNKRCKRKLQATLGTGGLSMSNSGS